MVQNLLKSTTSIVMLFVIILIQIVIMWQNNNIEAQNMQLAKRGDNISVAQRSTPTTNPTESLGVWDKYNFAFSDPSNLLELDKEEWLPTEAKQGGTLLSYLTADPQGLNFLTKGGADVSELQNYITIGLMRRHFADTTKWHPEFAYHMGRTDDFLTYTFKLRDDIFWHEPTLDLEDSQYAWIKEGSTCRKGHFIDGRCRATAHDIVFMMDMTMNSQVAGAAPLRSYFGNIDFYAALDDFTFVIRFHKKTQTQDLMVRGVLPMPEFIYAYDQNGQRYDDSILGTKFEAHWYDPHTLGCGPYRYVTFEPGVQIVLEKDPWYPLGGNAFHKIIFQIIQEDQQRIRKIRTNELDFTGLSPSQYRTQVLEGEADSPFKDGTFGHQTYWTHSYFYIGWNNQSPLFSDKKVRQAMSHAFHADLLLEQVMMGLGQRTTGPMPSFLPYYNKDIPMIPFDLEKAKVLLAEAGWQDKDGNGILEKEINGEVTEFEFNLMIYGSSAEYKTIGDIFKEDLAKIGVQMNVTPTEWSLMLNKVDNREFDAVTLAWVSSPDVDFRQIWHSSQADTPQSSNHISFKNAEADKIIEALEVEFDPEKRIALAQQFHALLYEEQPYTFFFTRKSMFYWNKKLGNAKAQVVRPYLNARAWYAQ